MEIKDEELASRCLKQLAQMSETPQHEMIAQMIEYYDVEGTKDLSGKQMCKYIQIIIEKRMNILSGGTINESAKS